MVLEALVVGINQYIEEDIPNLRQAAADAEAIAQLLEKHSAVSYVKRLPAEEIEGQRQVAAEPHPTLLPTTEKLKEEIKHLLHLDSNNPLPHAILFYFSGHSFRAENQGYLATSDFKNNQDTGIPLVWFVKQLQKSPVKQQIIWLDCCYAGELINCPELTSEESDYVRCIITSSRDDESSTEDLHHGVLTDALLKALDPKNTLNHPNGFVLSHDLENLIKTEFKQHNIPQTPQFFNSETAIVLTQINPQDYTGQCPYRDLRYFTENAEDAELFYGRQTEINWLIEAVKNNNFLAILGRTGSGKSSLIRAGLLYQLRLGQKIPGSNHWKILGLMKPKEKPFERLMKLVENASTLQEAVSHAQEERVILIVDQFEECFTGCSVKERHNFFQALIDALEQTSHKFCLIIGMRIDYLNNFLESRTPLASYLEDKNRQIWLKPLQQNQLEQAIIQPAKKLGLEVEAGLAVEISHELLNLPRHLPLLQYVMKKIFEQAKRSGEPRLLTRKMYQSLGNIKNVLKQRANKIYENLGSEDEKSVARKIFLELTRLDHGRYTRRRVIQADLVNAHHSQAQVEKVIYKLEDAGLITQEKDDENSETIIDIAHEALISDWEKLHHWVQKNEVLLKIRNEIKAATKTWKENGRSRSPSSGFLLHGDKLNQAKCYLNEHGKLGYLKEDAEDFIKISIAVEERKRKEELQSLKEQLKQLQKARRKAENARKQEENARRKEENARRQAEAAQKTAQTIMWIVFSVTVVAVVLGIMAWRFEQKAQLREKVANIRHLVHVNAFEALVRAIEATGSSQKILSPGQVFPSVQGSLRESIQLASQKEVLVGHAGAILSVAVNPQDKNLIATGDSDGKLWLWKYNHYPRVRAFNTLQTSIDVMTFRQNGDLITGSLDGTVTLWERQGSRLKFKDNLEDYFPHQGRIFAIAIDPKANYIARSSADGTVELLNLQTQEIQEIKLNHQGTIKTLALSPEGEYLLSGGEDGQVKLWDRKTQKTKDLISPPTGAIQSIAISSDRQYIASGDEEGQIKIWHWNQQTGEFKPVKLEHQGIEVTTVGAVNSLSFSWDHQYLVSGGENKMVRVWNLNRQKLEAKLEKKFMGHGQGVNGVVFSPNNQLIYSGSDDSYLRLWSMKENSRSNRLWTHDHRVTSVSVSQDSKVLFASVDGNVYIWDRQRRKEAKPLPSSPTREEPVSAVAMSRDGRLIVGGNPEGFLRVWIDLKEELQQKPNIEAGSPVKTIAMTSDEKWIVSGSENGKVHVWKRENNQVKWIETLPLPVREPNSIQSIAIADGNHDIAIGDDKGVIWLWNSMTKDVERLEGHHQGAVNTVTFSPDGKYLISGSQDKTVRVWSTEEKQPLGEPLRGHHRGVNSVAILSGFTSATDEWLLVSGGEGGTLLLWIWNRKTEQGQHIAQLVQDYQGAINALAVRPDGSAIISSAGNQVRVWEGGTWEAWLEKACKLWKGEDLSLVEDQILINAARTCQKQHPQIWTEKIMAQFWLNQSQTLVIEGNLNQAKKFLKKAHQLDPDLEISVEDLMKEGHSEVRSQIKEEIP